MSRHSSKAIVGLLLPLGLILGFLLLTGPVPSRGEPRARQKKRPANAAGAKRGTAANAVQHGKYLVHHVAMCVICHTPKTREGKLIETELLHGAPIPVKDPYPGRPWALRAPRLAGLPGGWNESSLVRFLQTGKTPQGNGVRPPMPPFRMSEIDARAVVAYLKSLDGD